VKGIRRDRRLGAVADSGPPARHVIMEAMGRPTLAAVADDKPPARQRKRRTIATALTADLRGVDLDGRRTLAALAKGLAQCADQATAAGDGYRLAQISGEMRKVLTELMPADHDGFDDLLRELSAPIDEDSVHSR
jgi:hypothetical protein